MKVQVSIFMSPLNMHNNLYPIEGEIKYKKYHPGKFLFAWNPKSSTDNEREVQLLLKIKVFLFLLDKLLVH